MVGQCLTENIPIDTARAYTNSEKIVGLTMRDKNFSSCNVTTKLSPLTELSSADSMAEVAAKVENSINESINLLGNCTPNMLLHRASHLFAMDGLIWRILLKYKSKGMINELGVSIQNTSEALLALKVPEVKILQLPLNVLDDRWQESGVVSLINEKNQT